MLAPQLEDGCYDMSGASVPAFMTWFICPGCGRMLCGNFLTLYTFAKAAGYHLRSVVLMGGGVGHKGEMGFGLDEKECDT